MVLYIIHKLLSYKNKFHLQLNLEQCDKLIGKTRFDFDYKFLLWKCEKEVSGSFNYLECDVISKLCLTSSFTADFCELLQFLNKNHIIFSSMHVRTYNTYKTSGKIIGYLQPF